MNDPYPKEEIDLMHKLLDSKIEHNQKELLMALKQQEHTHKEFQLTMKEGFSQVYIRQDELDQNQKFTNGKLKKMIIALVAIGAFALGSGMENIVTLFKYLV